MVFPSRRRNLVGNQFVGRVGIRDSQQRFGNAHQQNAFLGGQVVLLQECIDSAFPGLVSPHGTHEPGSHDLNLFPGRVARIRCIGQIPDQRLFVSQVAVVDVRDGTRSGGRLICKTHSHHHSSLRAMDPPGYIKAGDYRAFQHCPAPR